MARKRAITRDAAGRLRDARGRFVKVQPKRDKAGRWRDQSGRYTSPPKRKPRTRRDPTPRFDDTPSIDLPDSPGFPVEDTAVVYDFDLPVGLIDERGFVNPFLSDYFDMDWLDSWDEFFDLVGEENEDQNRED